MSQYCANIAWNMMIRTSGLVAATLRRAAFVVLFSLLAFPSRADGPFDSLIGAWSGTGTIALTSGAKERIRCRASYRLEFDEITLRLQLRCDSDSYKFELGSQIRYQGGAISGVWSENTRGVAGNITGRLTPTLVQARAEGQTFSALLTMNTRGSRQTVSIRSPGSEMQEVAIVLNRDSR